MAIARAQDRDLSLLVRPLLQDDSASVRAAAMLALARTGNSVDLSPLAAMLSENDAEVRGNAYLVLGELGNRSAVPLIRESLGRGMRLVNPVRARLVDLSRRDEELAEHERGIRRRVRRLRLEQKTHAPPMVWERGRHESDEVLGDLTRRIEIARLLQRREGDLELTDARLALPLIDERLAVRPTQPGVVRCDVEIGAQAIDLTLRAD